MPLMTELETSGTWEGLCSRTPSHRSTRTAKRRRSGSMGDNDVASAGVRRAGVKAAVVGSANEKIKHNRKKMGRWVCWYKERMSIHKLAKELPGKRVSTALYGRDVCTLEMRARQLIVLPKVDANNLDQRY